MVKRPKSNTTLGPKPNLDPPLGIFPRVSFCRVCVSFVALSAPQKSIPIGCSRLPSINCNRYKAPNEPGQGLDLPHCSLELHTSTGSGFTCSPARSASQDGRRFAPPFGAGFRGVAIAPFFRCFAPPTPPNTSKPSSLTLNSNPTRRSSTELSIHQWMGE